MSRPLLVTALAVLQFVAAGAGAIVLLGNGTLDSELSPLDVAAAVGVAILGALVVGTSWNGGRAGWLLQLVLAAAALVWGVLLVLDDKTPVVVGAAVVWLTLLNVPRHRRWFQTVQPV
ncbi:MAG: hypothetical protein M3527_03025 [Actinomycetota bacterium]|nr:hypothetical protein [Acidimicrobiia bacterium]MDQ3293411.1 hypothetical protein [Actinomycetota bacterium]